MTALGPLDHVTRSPLPWRTEPDLTECGQPLDRLNGRLITEDELHGRISEIGQQRAAYATCMTCWDAVHKRRKPHGPIELLARELQAVQWVPDRAPGRLPEDGDRPGEYERAVRAHVRRLRLTRELAAIVALVDAHRDEFDDYLAGLDDTVSLADRRQARRKTATRIHHEGGAP